MQEGGYCGFRGNEQRQLSLCHTLLKDSGQFPPRSFYRRFRVMKGQNLLVWGMVFLLIVATMSTEAKRTIRMKCCTRKDMKLLRELHKHKAVKIRHFCKKCKKLPVFPMNPGIPLPYL
ncbi:hypothetical protein AAFF_G00297150 [Aldrovandia affinis]|uniref:Uncharacterized protein n=1 Tax=Aldrovandia affinis TaxID=143900 RepID=A0AAD7WSJ8_9TELE|nr:hypothetical protein AAFF_G00297150 [Aldrovandia affinis]